MSYSSAALSAVNAISTLIVSLPRVNVSRIVSFALALNMNSDALNTLDISHESATSPSRIIAIEVSASPV